MTTDLSSAVRNAPTAGPRFGRLAGLALATWLVASGTGCGALLLVGGAGSGAIAFATGELRTVAETPIVELHEATRIAVETLRYEDVEAELNGDSIRWQATTAGGDPVDIRLYAQDATHTEIRIRIGVFGNEARSRLVLEQIRQAL